MKLTTGKILKYTLTPQILPRFQDLFYSGFSTVAFFMGQIYRSVRLLPADHPYLSPENMGRFGVRHVIAEASRNLVYKKENIDQIILFYLLLTGIVLLVAQIAMLFCSVFLDVAHAQLYDSSRPQDFFSYFSTPDATHELAFVLLDRVFGIPGGGGTNTSFFADASGGFTCVVEKTRCFDLGQSSRFEGLSKQDGIDLAVATDYARGNFAELDFPWPYHEALRGMVQVYSVGLLVIAVLIFIYFIFAVAAETAQTGTAYGRRFNQLWAPIRMVFAMGLLIPIAAGLNPAQWILMYAAKWGSSFATNGWIIYTNALTSEETLLGPRDELVATPSAPPVNTLMEFFSVVSTCVRAYERMYERSARPSLDVQAWLVNDNEVGLTPELLDDMASLNNAAEYFNGGDIIIRFGARQEDAEKGGFQSFDGEVAPLCGEITMNLTYVPENFVFSADMTERGSWHMLTQYYILIWLAWQDIKHNQNFMGSLPYAGEHITFYDIGTAMADRHIAIDNNADTPLPTAPQLNGTREIYQHYVRDQIILAVNDQRESPEWLEQLTELGWGGAAIWYNKIAQLNGGLVSAVYSMPTPMNYPMVMEKVLEERASSDAAISGETRFRTYTGTDRPTQGAQAVDKDMAEAMFQTQALWRDYSSQLQKKGNIYIDAINAIFGTEGLFNITSNEAQNVHPLAQLAAIGRSIVDSAVRNLGYSAAAGLGGGIMNIFQQSLFGRVAAAGSSFLFQIAMIGLAIGFVLFYIIPFMPFIYFFFAVGGWIKGIFEAMVGVPLWALAHIRIDGNGLPGDAAMGGYYLILEIFLRPILIIFGFIGSITIFTAQMKILHEVWSLVVSNVSGYQEEASAAAGTSGSIEFMRSAVDEFFFTLIYAILAYMLAMGSFKLVDQVPNHILRWMGANVSTFGDQSGDPAQNLIRNSYFGANMLQSRLSQGVSGMTSTASGSSNAMAELATRARP